MTRTITNNRPRPILSARDLTETERKEFDYIADGEGSFFRYKGRVYDLGEFTRTLIDGWDGISADTMFSATLVKFVDDETVIVARAYC